MIEGEAITAGSVLVAIASCLIILACSIWAHYRFADYDRLPRQFGLTLKPTAYGPRWMMVWMPPAILIGSLALIVALPAVVPPQHINGDPETGVLIAAPVMVAAQIFILWLLTRWANGRA